MIRIAKFCRILHASIPVKSVTRADRCSFRNIYYWQERRRSHFDLVYDLVHLVHHHEIYLIKSS